MREVSKKVKYDLKGAHKKVLLRLIHHNKKNELTEKQKIASISVGNYYSTLI